MKNKYHSIALLIGLLIGSSGVFAQQKANKLSLSYGVLYGIKVDKVYSRLPRYGINHTANLAYEGKHKNRLIGVDIHFSTGTLGLNTSRISQLSNFAGLLSLKYLFKLAPNKLKDKKTTLYAGGSMTFRGEIWFPQFALLAYGWDLNAGVGADLSIQHKFSAKLSVQYDFNIHTLGVLWRPHNNGQQLTTEKIQKDEGILAAALENPQFSHPFNALYLTNSVKIVYALSDKFEIYYNFILGYRQIKVPLVKKGYDLKNLIGLTYKF